MSEQKTIIQIEIHEGKVSHNVIGELNDVKLRAAVHYMQTLHEMDALNKLLRMNLAIGEGQARIGQVLANAFNPKEEEEEVLEDSECSKE